MQDIVNIFDRIDNSHKVTFANKFFSIWGENGFGTLTKKDTELLIFSCLENLLDGSKPRNNYEWSNALKIPQTKVKNLRLEAYLKFDRLFVTDDAKKLEELLRQCFSEIDMFRISEADLSLNGGEVSFVVEDPIVLRELSKRLKDMHSALDFNRNREIVRMSLRDFLIIVSQVAGLGEEKLINKLASSAAMDAKKMKEMKGKIEKAGFKQLSEGQKLINFIKFLGETFAEKPTKLLEYLKRIF